ncbi:hypothetical protein XBJ1_1875 [Xenorhabdus bovienii SS-2004]|uniref:Uncharacterized protein n=1 Tax=Xenorhabdus bovienii (strain SS-2004) TaxID=406818 RepID=D3V2N6_XENBS|nr:hypothetical protein XBJ1_1875 [Xenorhabdus bovienii SS-2004]
MSLNSHLHIGITHSPIRQVFTNSRQGKLNAVMLIKMEKNRFISKTISVNGTQGRFVVLIFKDED